MQKIKILYKIIVVNKNMNIIIYHNPRWSKSRESVKILKKECNSFRIIEYLKESIDKKTIQDILNILNVNAIDLIRKNDTEFKNLNLSENEINNSNLLIDLIIKYPKIMQRPIILNENKGVIGRPPENIYNIL